MNELTLDAARRKYDFVRLAREDYTRVREVPPDAKGEGALFAYAPEKDGYVGVDMYLTHEGRAEPGVADINCHPSNVDKVVEAIASGDFDALGALTAAAGQ